MEFWDTEPAKPAFDYDVEKEKFIGNMDYTEVPTYPQKSGSIIWISIQHSGQHIALYERQKLDKDGCN